MKITRKCAHCNDDFETRPIDVRNGGGKYCSRTCQGAARTAATIASRPNLKQPMSYRLIPLAGGHVTKVSIEDFDELSVMSWQVSNTGYVQRRGDVLMHQYIVRKIYGEYESLLLPDHINRDPLDNRRSNLRLVTPFQNAQNRRRSNSSYIGVQTDNASYRASIRAEGTKLYLGSFTTPEDAAYVRDQFAIVLHGQHAVLNFEY